MNALLVAMLMTTTPEVTTAADLDVAQPERETRFSLSFSPLTTLMLGAAVEGEFRVAPQLTGYVAGEFYGAWMGWGVQTGVRFYPSQAFKGFFVDGHARASDLLLNHLAGGGLEVGSQHTFGRSRWAFLWSVGADVGVGGYYAAGGTNLGWLETDGVTVLPKLRLMLGYHF